MHINFMHSFIPLSERLQGHLQGVNAMVEPSHSKMLSKPTSDSDGTREHLVNAELQRAASTIYEQLEDLLLIASDHQMDMLSYLIEMAMLEAASTVKRSSIQNQT